MSRGKSNFSKIRHGKCVERGIRHREKLDIRMITLSYGPVNNRRIICGIIERRRYEYVCIVCDSFSTNWSWGSISRDSVALITRQDKKCEEYENCEKLSFLRRNYGETINGNLRRIKNEGVEAVKSRGNKYYTWQRR